MSILDLLDPLHREGIRGVFAIGTVASIIALRDRIDPTVAYFGVNIVSLLNLLLVFWVSYIFLMAIGVSEDIFGRPFSRFCFGLGRMSFAVGIMLLLVILVPAFFLAAYNWLLTLPREVVLVSILVLIYLIVRAGRKKNQAKPQKAEVLKTST